MQAGTRVTGFTVLRLSQNALRRPARVCFRADRTLSRHRRMTEFDPKATSMIGEIQLALRPANLMTFAHLLVSATINLP